MVEKNLYQVSSERIFVLDTNVLLYDWKSIYSFTGATIIVPLVVLEELDSFKGESSERGRNSRRVIRIFDEIRAEGSLADGVIIKTNNGHSLLRVVQFSSNDIVFDSSNDNKIIGVVDKLSSSGAKVTFITKDINARVKTDLLGLQAEDYVVENVSIETQYKGWSSFEISPADVKRISIDGIHELVDISDLYENQFIHVKSDFERAYERLFKFVRGKIVEVEPFEPLWGFGEKNIQQRMALDLLLDDSVSLLSLIGSAGTGKTFLTLLAGIYKVLKQNMYRKMLIARPVVALGSDIGFLPGDVNEKLFHWMQPMHDNLELILMQSKKAFQKLISDDDRGEHQSDFVRYHERSSRPSSAHGRHRRDNHRDSHRSARFEPRGLLQDYHHSGEWKGMYAADLSAGNEEIERLKRKGILSFEAITYMRGRSIPKQFIFIDEVQNLTPHEVKTIVSRAGEGTKVILAGDPDQIDSPYMDYATNGLTVTTEKFKGDRIFGVVKLEICERSLLAERAARLL